MHKPGIRRGCCSRLLLHVARRFQLSGILLPTPCPSVTAISSAPWRFFAGPWTTAWTSPATSPAGPFSSGAAWSRPWEECCRRRPRQLEQQRLIMERQTRRRSHRQISTRLPRCRWPPAPRLARQASRPTRPSPAMWTVDQSGATPAQAKGPPASQWESEGFRSYSDALAAENMGYLTAGDYYARIAAPPVKKAPAVPPPEPKPPVKKAPAVPPPEVKRQPTKFPPARPASSAASSSSAPVPGTPEFARLQAEIEAEIRAGASSRPTSSTLAMAEPKAGQPDHPPAPPAGFINMRIGADWFVINRTTGEGYPPCPRKPPRDATARVRAENEEEFRRIVGIYRLLNSLEHTAHIERMHRPGATADFPLPPEMVPSAVRTIDELEERERAADAAPGGHGGLIPVAPGRLHCHLPGAELPRRARAGAHSRRGVGRRLVRRTLPGPRRHAMHRPRREMPSAGYRPARRRRQPGGAYRPLV